MLRSSWGRFVALIGRNLAPNRAAIWVTALANVTGALVTMLSSFTIEQTSGVVAGLVGLNTLCVVFLKGWQQYERAGQQDQLTENELRYQVHARSGGYNPTPTPKQPAGQDAAKRLGLKR